MSSLDFSGNPEYAEAASREQVNRDLAFLPEAPAICGIRVRHMTPRHHILLSGCRNRFVVGGHPQPEDVAMFLWFVSPEYTTVPGFREVFVNTKVRPLDFYEAARAIYAYMERVWQDWPAGDGATRKQYTAPVASTIDLLASEYGWSDEMILEMPLARIFQYIRRIEIRHNPKAMQFNASDRHLSEALMARIKNADGKPDN